MTTHSSILAWAVKLEDVSAKLENGVLTISIKKRSEKEIEKEHLVQIA